MSELPNFNLGNIKEPQVEIKPLSENGFDFTPEFASLIQGFVMESFLQPEYGEKYDEGGNAEIFTSTHPSLQGLCLKRLKKDPDMKIMNIHQEALLQNQAHGLGIRTPLVICHAIVPDTGEEFLVMEYVNGPNLGKIRDSEALLPDFFEPKMITSFIADLRNQVAKLHEGGIHHRDLKPENILVSPGGEPVIIDFGVSARYRGDDEIEPYLYDGQVLRTVDGVTTSPEGRFIKDVSHIDTAKHVLANYFKSSQQDDDYGFEKLARM